MVTGLGIDEPVGRQEGNHAARRHTRVPLRPLLATAGAPPAPAPSGHDIAGAEGVEHPAGGVGAVGQGAHGADDQQEQPQRGFPLSRREPVGGLEHRGAAV